MPRRGTYPDENRLLLQLSEWLWVRKKPVLEALMKDVENELDRLTAGRFKRDVVLAPRALYALEEVIKSIANESFIKGCEVEADKNIDKLVRSFDV